MLTQTGLELEYRQCHIYVFIAIILYLITGYFLLFIFFIMLVYTVIEEVDPEEIDEIEELSPFLDQIYVDYD
jgi:hypothetical protein